MELVIIRHCTSFHRQLITICTITHRVALKKVRNLLHIHIYHLIIHFLWSGGCPIYKQDWCGYLPGIHSIQMILGFLFIVTGYPMGSAMSNAIYSKVIGPHPQVLINWNDLLYRFILIGLHNFDAGNLHGNSAGWRLFRSSTLSTLCDEYLRHFGHLGSVWFHDRSNGHHLDHFRYLLQSINSLSIRWLGPSWKTLINNIPFDFQSFNNKLLITPKFILQ